MNNPITQQEIREKLDNALQLSQKASHYMGVDFATGVKIVDTKYIEKVSQQNREVLLNEFMPLLIDYGNQCRIDEAVNSCVRTVEEQDERIAELKEKMK